MKRKATILILMLTAAPALRAIDESQPLSRATKAYHQGSLEQAQGRANAHLLWEGQSVDARYVAARIAIARGKCDEALPWLNANIKEAPRDFRSWHLLGQCHVRLGKVDEGVKCLKKALELNAYNGPSYLWLAKAMTDKKAQKELLEQVLVLEERYTPTAKEAIQMLDSQ